MNPSKVICPGRSQELGLSRILIPFASLALVLVALQAASVLAVFQISQVRTQHQLVVTAVQAQRDVAHQYERANYHALAALSMSDWKRLLEQREEIHHIEERVEATYQLLLVHIGQLQQNRNIRESARPGGRVNEDGTSTSTLLQQFGLVWQDLKAASVRILRSSNREVRDNPWLARFQATTAELTDVQGQIANRVAHQAAAAGHQLHRLQLAIPVAAVMLTLCLAFFVYRRMIRPLVDSLRILARQKDELHHKEAHIRAILDNAVDGIVTFDKYGQLRTVNPAAEAIMGHKANNLIGNDDLAGVFQQGENEAILTPDGQGSGSRRLEAAHEDGTRVPLEVRVSKMDGGDEDLYIAIIQDITEREEAQREVMELNRRMVDMAREAGMSQVATGVLHNVGNVLNSVNISTQIVVNTFQRSPIAAGLDQTVSLLQRERGDLPGFFASTKKADALVSYLAELTEASNRERDLVKFELDSLAASIEHIKEIVQAQQSLASRSDLRESVSLADLIEHAIKVSGATAPHQGISIVRQFNEIGMFETGKHKVLQILVNLLSNAKHAVQAKESGPLTITVRLVQKAASEVMVQVEDSGIGILTENLAAIFQHGFTTRKEGRGFGLHSCANTARELGGRLTAHSDGPGRGAVFTLILPVAITSDESVAALGDARSKKVQSIGVPPDDIQLADAQTEDVASNRAAM